MESLSDDLAAVGFDLSPLGGGSYAINGIPSGIEGLNWWNWCVIWYIPPWRKAVTSRKKSG